MVLILFTEKAVTESVPIPSNQSSWWKICRFKEKLSWTWCSRNTICCPMQNPTYALITVIFAS